jgi:hypothetical protein
VTETVIHAELAVRACTAELYLNGIRLRRQVAPERPYVSIPVRQYLVPGSNHLEMVVEPGQMPSQARQGKEKTAKPGASAVARLTRYEEGQIAFAKNGEKLIEIRWQGSADEETFPKILGAESSLGPVHGRWSWQDAPPLCLDEATRTEIADVLATVARAFERGDPAPMIDLLAVRFVDVVRAYPANALSALNEDLAHWVRTFGSKGWKVLPLAPEQHDFRLCAGNRLVEVVDRDGLPSLRLKPPDEEEPHPYAMLLARIDGRLVPVR